MTPSVAFACVVLVLSFELISTAAATIAFNTIEAEHYDVNSGALALPGLATTPVMTLIEPGDYLVYKNVQFLREAIAIELQVASDADPATNPKIYFRLDSLTADPFAVYRVQQSFWARFIKAVVFIPIGRRPTAVHDLYLTFDNDLKSGYVVNIDHFKFIPTSSICVGQQIVSPPSISSYNQLEILLTRAKDFLITLKNQCPRPFSTFTS